MPRLQPWFDIAKAAQVAAWFAAREGGSIAALKLAKLIYLADRANLEAFDFAVTGDNFVSTDHGPANAITQDLIAGMHGSVPAWDRFIAPHVGYAVATATVDLDTDRLSRAELATLDATWQRFGSMTAAELRDWTRAHCPEWEDPQGSSSPIPLARVLKFLGKAAPDALAEDLLAGRQLRERVSDGLFAVAV